MSAPPRPSRARACAIEVNAARCRPRVASCDRGGIKADPVARDPTRPQQPAPPQRGGSCQRPHPSSEIKKENAGASRSDPRARRSAPPRPSRARACAIEVNAVVPSSCDRGGIKADPVARDPTRPQQPAPPQRGGSCQRPHPSSEIKKENAGASRSDPRARRSAPPRPSRARACAIEVNAVVPSSCDRGGIKADPVARDPTRPQQPAPPQRGGSCQRPHPSSEIKKENAGASRSDPRARRSAPPRPSRARACAIEVNAAQNACLASQLGVPSRREAPSAVQLRRESKPTPLLATQRGRSSRRRRSGAAAANAPHPSSEIKKENAGASRSDPRARRSAPPRPSRARACAIEVNAAQNACLASQLGSRRADLVPSSCDGVESKPTPLLATQRGRSSRRRRSGAAAANARRPHPSSEIKKENAGASRSDPRARRSAPPRPSRARACAIEVNAGVRQRGT